MQSFVQFTRSFVFHLAIVILLVSTGQGRSDSGIVLAPGDTISYSILGAPELDKISVIGVNGRLQLPLVGSVDAAGLTIDDLRTKVASEVSEVPFRDVGPDGEEVWRRISSDLLFIDVASYRPIYLMGDVRASGEQPYRPGITLRQAIARAGGLGLALDPTTSEAQLLEISEERDILLSEIGLVKATLAILEADLTAIGENMADEGTEGTDAYSARDNGGARWLSARNKERQLSRGNSELIAEQMKNRLEVLRELLRTQQVNLDIEQAALDRAKDLSDRGLTPAANVIDARRGVLQVSMQTLETSGEIHALELDLARTKDEVERLQYTQRVELLDQIVTQTGSLQTLNKRLSALDQRLTMLGGQTFVTEVEPVYRFVVQRAGEDAVVTDKLSDIELLPGDVVEVSVGFKDENEATAAATQ